MSGPQPILLFYAVVLPLIFVCCLLTECWRSL